VRPFTAPALNGGVNRSMCAGAYLDDAASKPGGGLRQRTADLGPPGQARRSISVAMDLATA